MRVFGLLGYPLGHSFSGAFFMEKFSKEGHSAIYRNYELQSLSGLSTLISSNPDLEGLNVTIPYKTGVMEYLDDMDPFARDIGAVNVIRITRNEKGFSLKGYNTDIIGFKKSVSTILKSDIRSSLILGTGGSSLAVQKGLDLLGISYKTVSRSKEAGNYQYSDLSKDLIDSCSLIINTTPLGMFPEIEGYPDIPYDLLTKNHILFDLVYNPELTRFLAIGKEKGCIIKGGLEMLHIQAEEAWSIWNPED